MKGKTLINFILAILFCTIVQSCSGQRPDPDPRPAGCRKVLLLYSSGYNNLEPYLRADINDMCSNAPAVSVSRYDKVLVFSHFKKADSPALMEAVTGPDGKPRLDTLVRYDSSTSSVSAETVENVLKYIRANFPAQEYGMIMSSHANGWIPAGYFSSPWDTSDNPFFIALTSAEPVSLPFFAENPEVKALCFQDDASCPTGGIEMELSDFVDAISNSGIHLRYLALDMCLMGSVEVAYALKDAVDYLVFSPTEVLSDGFAYGNILDRLLYSSFPDVVGVCQDYFTQYMKSGRSATISAVDCTRLDPLAELCSRLFSKYRDELAALNLDLDVEKGGVQPYCDLQYRRFFFDLEDALVKAGISDAERAELEAVLAECVMHHSETEIFSVSGESFKLKNCCGFSMYLSDGRHPGLDGEYKKTAWNKATSLVR